MKIVLVTGGFDPLHSGHIDYFNAAKQLGDKLIVGLNSDEWLTRKKGRPFMPIYERDKIVSSLRVVDKVVHYPDADNSSKNAITGVRRMYPNATIIFANGGDRTKENIPEMEVDDDNIEFVFEVGGDHKQNSSSWILREWKQPKTLRQWGYYRILHDVQGCKVKELTVDPGQSLSMQRHFKRHEFWHVTEGKCILYTKLSSGYSLLPIELSTFGQVKISRGDWHQLSNPYDIPCRIVEIQYGEECDELDIERENA
jgi:D-beta-D-heptose 7-phosphate kinase/D-beta-D-heptose 1-phosphate adenosyltransferase